MKYTIKVSDAGSEDKAWTQATKLVNAEVRKGKKVYVNQNNKGTDKLWAIVVEVEK